MSALYIGQAFSQEGEPAGRGARRQRDSGDRAQRIAEWRAQIAERFREKMGATKEEWQVLSPMIEKVQTLSRQVRFGTMMGLLSGRDGRRGGRRAGGSGEEGTDDRPQTDIQKTTQALQKLAENDSATAQELQAAMKALRDAKAKVQKELTDARKALREVVTVRQEAQLVLLGLLE